VGQLTVASSQLWLFFAFAIPLTAATFGYWKWKDRKLRLKDLRKVESDEFKEP
jgi:hypothetical protein